MSIFDIEKRVHILYEEEKILDLLDSKVSISFDSGYNYKSITILDLIDQYFLSWPHRKTAINFEDYMEDLTFNLGSTDIILTEDKQFLYWMELLKNTLHHSVIELSKEVANDQASVYDLDELAKYVQAINTNLEVVAEGLNYRFREIEHNNSVVFKLTKRDYQLDAAINSIDNRDLSHDLLSYLDLRNENNIKEKTRIVAELYKYFESLDHLYQDTIIYKKDKNSKNINLLNEFNFVCNNFNMRHWPKEIHRNFKEDIKKDISEDEMLELLNICFYLGLQLIISRTTVTSYNTVQDYKKKYGFK